MSDMQWQPSTKIAALKKRALVIQRIRQFFIDRQVLEVDTPALSHHASTDEHLHSFQCAFQSPYANDLVPLYLQTSPEFAMKRLLCAGSGSIFQICKAFRNEEAGRYHNPEFTILEWYQVGYDHFQLMAEVDELVQQVLGSQPAEQVSYQEVFLRVLQIDPLESCLEQIKQVASEHGFADIARLETDKDILLMLLFSQVIEPVIGIQAPCLVYHFPASQASLARISPQDNRVAERFELYYQGVELANGFHELQDANEQRQRFEADNSKRQAKGLPIMPLDTNLIQALQQGLPECAGVALGIDRLLMLAFEQDRIDHVMAFPQSRA